MAGETVITVVGNVVDEQPELRFTPAGKAVVKFRVASTPRTFDRDSNSWRDGEPLFLTCSAWGQMGENAASTLTKGMRVIVQGRLKQRSYEDKQGVKRTVFELDVDEVGVSLRNAMAKVTKAGGSQGGGREAFQGARQQSQHSAGGPWSQPAGAGAQSGGWGAGAGGDEPPF